MTNVYLIIALKSILSRLLGECYIKLLAGETKYQKELIDLILSYNFFCPTFISITLFTFLLILFKIMRQKFPKGRKEDIEEYSISAAGTENFTPHIPKGFESLIKNDEKNKRKNKRGKPKSKKSEKQQIKTKNSSKKTDQQVKTTWDENSEITNVGEAMVANGFDESKITDSFSMETVTTIPQLTEAVSINEEKTNEIPTQLESPNDFEEKTDTLIYQFPNENGAQIETDHIEENKIEIIDGEIQGDNKTEDLTINENNENEQINGEILEDNTEEKMNNESGKIDEIENIEKCEKIYEMEDIENDEKIQQMELIENHGKIQETAVIENHRIIKNMEPIQNHKEEKTLPKDVVIKTKKKTKDINTNGYRMENDSLSSSSSCTIKSKTNSHSSRDSKKGKKGCSKKPKPNKDDNIPSSILGTDQFEPHFPKSYQIEKHIVKTMSERKTPKSRKKDQNNNSVSSMSLGKNKKKNSIGSQDQTEIINETVQDNSDNNGTNENERFLTETSVENVENNDGDETVIPNNINEEPTENSSFENNSVGTMFSDKNLETDKGNKSKYDTEPIYDSVENQIMEKDLSFDTKLETTKVFGEEQLSTSSSNSSNAIYKESQNTNVEVKHDYKQLSSSLQNSDYDTPNSIPIDQFQEDGAKVVGQQYEEAVYEEVDDPQEVDKKEKFTEVKKVLPKEENGKFYDTVNDQNQFSHGKQKVNIEQDEDFLEHLNLESSRILIPSENQLWNIYNRAKENVSDDDNKVKRKKLSAISKIDEKPVFEDDPLKPYLYEINHCILPNSHNDTLLYTIGTRTNNVPITSNVSTRTELLITETNGTVNGEKNETHESPTKVVKENIQTETSETPKEPETEQNKNEVVGLGESINDNVDVVKIEVHGTVNSEENESHETPTKDVKENIQTVTSEAPKEPETEVVGPKESINGNVDVVKTETNGTVNSEENETHESRTKDAKKNIQTVPSETPKEP
ncbi:hypothetical protein SNEBB_000560, partial [Seison nebaliae]